MSSDRLTCATAGCTGEGRVIHVGGETYCRKCGLQPWRDLIVRWALEIAVDDLVGGRTEHVRTREQMIEVHRRMIHKLEARLLKGGVVYVSALRAKPLSDADLDLERAETEALAEKAGVTLPRTPAEAQEVGPDAEPPKRAVVH